MKISLTKLLSGIAVFGIAVSAYGLNIVPTFDSSIVNDPNGPAIMAAINAAIQVVQSDIVDNVTVNILFTNDPSISLGQSSTFPSLSTTYSYSAYLAALKNSATSVYDTNAISRLPNSATDPVIGGTRIRLTYPLARLMGLSSSTGPQGFDSTIALNMPIMNFTRPPGVSTNYDLQQVVEHEIDEVLGCSSYLTYVSSGFPIVIAPIDLFRYTTNRARTFTTNGDDAYFCVDGTNLLARFNMNAGGDYSDFWSYTANWAPPGTTAHPQVQDAFNTPGVVIDYGVNELGMEDVIGWTLSASAKASLTPPTVNFTFPAPGAVLADSPIQVITGTAADIAAALGSVRVALNRSSDGAWYDFVGGTWGTTSFNFNRDIMIATGTSSWSAQLPALPNGSYTVQAQSVDVFNHASLWQSVGFTLSVAPPVVTFSPLVNQQVVFNFDQLGGAVSVASTVKFQIEWFRAAGNLFWNGANWTSVASDPGALLAANLSGLNWSPAPGTLPPRLQLAQANYLIHVYATNSVGDGGYNDLVLARSPLDTTPPIVNLDSTSIHPGEVITNRFLPLVSGLAYDFESGVASVIVLLARSTASGFVYWDGANWTATPTNLTATYSSQNISWQLNVPLPGGANLPNATYSLDVSAQNNEAPTGSGSLNLQFSVDYHPVYVFTAGSFFDSIPNNENMRWDNSANWDVGSVPTTDARVVINNYSPDNTALGSLQLYRLDMSGGTLTTAGMLIQKLNLSGGALVGGAFTIVSNGVFSWSGGTITGTYNVPASATLNLTGSADKTMSYASLLNNGTVIWNGGNLLA